MLEWFKRKAIEKSRANIIALIDELIPVANAAATNLERNLTPNPRDISAVHKLQDRLLIQLCGPIPIDQVKREIIDPAMAKPNVSNGARMAILHTYNTAMGTSKND